MLPALHLPATTPTEGFWKNLFDSDRFDTDYQKNKAEFGEDVADAWQNTKKMIKHTDSTMLGSVLQNESDEDDESPPPYEKLLSMRLYFKKELKSLVEIAEYYLGKEVNERRKMSRNYILNNLKAWSQEYDDFMKNRAEFGVDTAKRWRKIKKFILYKQHQNLKYALHGGGKNTYQDLFSLRLYYKKKLTTLLEIARKYDGRYYDVYTSKMRSINDDLEKWSEEYYNAGGARPPAAPRIRDDENSDNAGNRPIRPYFVDEKSRQEHMKRGFAGVNLR